MSEAKIDQIIAAMRRERYRFAPVRRVHIPKKNGKLRPLGLPSWSDKLVGEVVRLLLEAYYEPQFSGRSHGFRKGRGCHTALREIQQTWTGTAWFIEGDISDCFGSFDHEILLGILAEKIRDNRFLRLIRNMLKAGYLEDWQYHDTLSGVRKAAWYRPSSVTSTWTSSTNSSKRELIPQYTRGSRRETEPEYHGKRRTAVTRGSAGTGRKPGTWHGRCAPFPPVTRWTPATGGCFTSGTPMISCWGSSGRRPKPSRSRPSWPRSCGRPSRWN